MPSARTVRAGEAPSAAAPFGSFPCPFPLETLSAGVRGSLTCAWDGDLHFLMVSPTWWLGLRTLLAQCNPRARVPDQEVADRLLSEQGHDDRHQGLCRG